MVFCCITNLNKMEDTAKLIKKKEGAMSLTLSGRNQITLNWKANKIEVYHNGKQRFVIDMSD